MFTSISFIAVGAFILTLGVVVYEVFLLKKKKEQPQNTKDVQLPDYQQDPQAVKNMSTVPNVVGDVAVQQVAQAPIQPRSLPSVKTFIGLGTGLILIVVLIGGGIIMYSRVQTSKKDITDATVDEKVASKNANVSPKAQQKSDDDVKPLNTATPSSTITPKVTIVVESSTRKTTGSGDLDDVLVSPIASSTPVLTAVITKSASGSSKLTPSSSTTTAELPRSGVIHQSLILGGVSLSFIVLAFIL